MRKVVVYLVSLFAFVIAAKGDFLNEYFDDKVFGVNPGPCVLQDGSCLMNLEGASFSDEIGGANFCILTGVCQDLRDWVKSGTAEIWNVQCKSIGVKSVGLAPVSTSTSVTRNNVTVANMVQQCTGKAKLTDVILTYQFLFFTISVKANLLGDWKTVPPASGLSVSFVLELSAAGAGGFNNNLVDHAEIDSCKLVIGLGLSFTGQTNKYELLGTGFSINSGAVTNLLIRLVEALFGQTICDVIEQAGTLDSGAQGVLNRELGQLNADYDKLIVPVAINVPGFDAQFQANPEAFGSNSAELSTALNLQDSNALELVSVALNEFLGNEDAADGLAINEAIGLLTEPDGQLFFDLDERDIDFTLPLNFADATMRIKSFQIVGLNTFNKFQILKNDYAENAPLGLDYTLNHSFGIDTFQFLIKIELILKRGTWVTASSCGTLQAGFPSENVCSSDQERFTFDFGMTAQNIFFDASTLVVANFEEISDLQIGQIIDQDLTDVLASASKVLQCAAPSIYAFNVSNLAFSIGTLLNPVVKNFDGDGLTQLIKDSTNLITILLKNLLANDLPKIMQGPVRNSVNAFLRTNVSDVTSATATCPDYVQIPSADPYLKFTEAPMNAIFPVINDVLGNFDANSNVDFNDFMEIVISYYSTNAAEFPLEAASASSVGDWDAKDSLLPFVQLPAFAGTFSDANAQISFTDFSIKNLDTVTKLVGTERNAFPYGIGIDVEFGGDASSANLEFSFSFYFKASDLQLDDPFTFNVALENTRVIVLFDEFLVNMDEINRLKFSQLLHTPCLFGVVDGITPDVFTSVLNASDIVISLDLANPSSTSALTVALKQLQQDLQSPDSSERFTRIINYVLSIGFEMGLTSVKNAVYDGTPELCDSQASDLGSIIDVFTGINLPNFTFFIDTCLGVIDPLPSIEDYELQQLNVASLDVLAGDPVDLTTNLLASLLQGALDFSTGGSGDVSSFQNLLITLANSTGNILSDILVLEDDNVTVSLEVVMNESSPILDLFGIEPFSFENDEGFLAQVTKFRVVGINSFIDDATLFEALSTFTFGVKMDFDSNHPLRVELLTHISANSTIVDLDPVGSPPVEEDILIGFELIGVKFLLETLFAFRADTFKKLSVAHFLSMTSDQTFFLTDFAGDCLFRNFYDGGLSIRNFSLVVDEVGTPTFDAVENNLISTGVEAVLTEMVEIVAKFYIDAIPNICQNCIREVLNSLFLEQLDSSRDPTSCPDFDDIPLPTLGANNQLLNFSDSPSIANLQKTLNEQVFSNDYDLWNKLVTGLTGEEFFDNNPFSTGRLTLRYKDVDYGDIEVNVTSLIVVNLGTFTNVKLAQPKSRSDTDFDELTDPYRVLFQVAFDGPSEFNMDVTFTGYEFFIQADVVRNDVSMDVTFSGFDFGLDAVMLFNLTRFFRIQFDQVDELSELPCLFVPISGMAVLEVNASTDEVQVAIDCIGQCDSELVESLTQTGEFVSSNPSQLAESFNTFMVFAVNYFATSPVDRIINVAAQTSESTCSALVGSVAGFFTPPTESEDVFIVMFYIFLAALALLFASILVLIPRHMRRSRARMARFGSLEKMDFQLSDEKLLFHYEQESLFQSSQIPILAKLVIPLVCVFNISALFFAVLTQGALNVIISITFLSMESNTVTLVPVTFRSSINDSWSIGAWPLAVVVALVSLYWPITKNVLLLCLWFMPTTIVGKRARSTMFEVLDLLGKWSFLDVFVVVLLVAGLYTYSTLSTQAQLTYLDPTFLEIVLNVQPGNGLVILSIAASSSMILNHVLGYYHMKTKLFHSAEFDRIANNPTTPPKIAREKLSIAGYKFLNRYVPQRTINVLLAVNLISGLVQVASLFVPIVTFNLKGLVALFLAQLGEDLVVRTYSVITMGATVANAPRGNAYEIFLVYFFQIIYFIITFVGPVLQCCAIAFLLLKKQSLKSLERTLFISLLISFWSAIDVVFVGLFVAILEVEVFSQYIVDFITSDYCTNLQPVIEVLTPGSENDTCFVVTAQFEPTVAILLFGLIFQLISLVFTMILVTRIKEDRYYRAYQKLRWREVKPEKMGLIKSRVIKLLTRPLRGGVKQLDESTVVSPDVRTRNVMKGPEDDENKTSSQFQYTRSAAFNDGPPPGFEIAPSVAPSVANTRRQSDDEALFEEMGFLPSSPKSPSNVGSNTNANGLRQGSYNPEHFSL